MASKITNFMSFEETAFRLKQSADILAIIATEQLSCTRCGSTVVLTQISNKNIHPTLKVLMCETCKSGYDLRVKKSQSCEWCSSEFNLCSCFSCSLKFCESCIKKHFRFLRTTMKEIKNKKWQCCVCSPKPIWEQRAICAAAQEFQSKKLKNVGNTVPLPFSQAAGKSAVVPNTSKNDAVSVKIANSNEPKKMEKHCVICMVSTPVMALIPCGHKCMCNACTNQLYNIERHCPLCRKYFCGFIRVYD